jgi:hypothetical protein
MCDQLRVLGTVQQAHLPPRRLSSYASLCPGVVTHWGGPIVWTLSSAIQVLCLAGLCHCGRGGHVYMRLTPSVRYVSHGTFMACSDWTIEICATEHTWPSWLACSTSQQQQPQQPQQQQKQKEQQ